MSLDHFKSFTFTMSVGVVEHRYGDSAADLLQRADTARYRAKSVGRNRMVCPSD